MLPGRQLGDRDRRGALLDAIDEHLRAGRLRLDLELTRLRRLRELEVLRHLGARGDVEGNHARHAAPAQLENVRARRHREARRRQSAIDPVDEHLHPRRVGLHGERAHGRRRR